MKVATWLAGDAPLAKAPKQLEQARELTKEERDQLAAFLQSAAGKVLMERARAIEFRDYRNERRASWRQAFDWLESLSRVPRDNGNEFDMEAGNGDPQLHERVSP